MSSLYKEQDITYFSSEGNIPKCNIMGVNVAAINMQWLIQYLSYYLQSPNFSRISGKYICVSNVHTIVMSYENTKYRSIQNNSLLAIPDGGPISSLGLKKWFTNMQRTTGPDLM